MCRVVVVCHAGAALKGYRPATLMGCGAYGNGARLTGMIDASLKIICYGCAGLEPTAEAYPSVKNGISTSKRFSRFGFVPRLLIKG